MLMKDGPESICFPNCRLLGHLLAMDPLHCLNRGFGRKHSRLERKGCMSFLRNYDHTTAHSPAASSYAAQHLMVVPVNNFAVFSYTEGTILVAPLQVEFGEGSEEVHQNAARISAIRMGKLG